MNNRILKVSSICTGFLEVPSNISINIYVQGCKIKCKDCHTPELQNFKNGIILTTDDVSTIVNTHDMSKWVCWLGGEPVDQIYSVIEFSKIFKEKHNLNIALYTGYLFEDLTTFDILKYVDLIKDGPFIKERGPVTSPTTNQRVFLKLNNIWKQINYGNIKTILER